MSAQGTGPSQAALNRLKGKKAIRSYARKLAEPETIRELNITPMMDMMTIILVFLLKSFATSTQLITFDSNLKPPASMSQLDPKQAISLTVTKRVVIIEGEPVAPINNGKIDPALKRDGENGYYVTPIVETLQKLSNRERRVAEMVGEKFEGELMVIADRDTPYRLLTEILYSCGQAGYANYRLLVLKARD